MKKALRKIHLWLSVPTGIIITLVCFSGAMLVFEKEITEAIKPELYFVKEAKGEPIPMQELMEKLAWMLDEKNQKRYAPIRRYDWGEEAEKLIWWLERRA